MVADKNFNRRMFLSSLIGLPVLAGSSTLFTRVSPEERNFPSGGKRLKTSLNAYSFNASLTNGTMNIQDMLEFCSESGFDGVDITGYYFKGYPAVPSDEHIYRIKRKAFSLGVEISGTGVRNDFTIADKNERQLEVELVKQWIEVASKLGAPVIRIFAGKQKNEGYAIIDDS